jgi:hypothetical protein
MKKILLIAGFVTALCCQAANPAAQDKYYFDKTISREVLENYLSRSITMEGLLNGRGDLDDNIRMLKNTGAKFIGRSLCLWGGEANLLKNLDRAREQVPKVLEADPQMILQACIFECVSTQVEQVPVPDWAFAALGQPAEKRNFRYEVMLFPEGHRRNWGPNASVPDITRPETKLWFYFLAKSYIDLGFEAIHFGQVELMGHNDPDRANWSQVLTLVRAYATQHGRRHMILCDGHVPSGGLVRDGHLLLDFHSFPLRIMETPEHPQEAVLKVGFSDGIYNRSKGGVTYSGWTCEHLPYLVELETGVSARSRGMRMQVGFGFGVMTKSPGLRIRAKNIVAAGCVTPGIGFGGRIQTAILKCLGAARCVLRWTIGGGIMRIIPANLSRMVWAMRKQSVRSGPKTRRCRRLKEG